MLVCARNIIIAPCRLVDRAKYPYTKALLSKTGILNNGFFF